VSKFIPAANFDTLAAEASQPGLVETAGDIVKVARRTVNRDTGGYEKSLRTVVDERGVVAETTDYAGHVIEWGSVNHSPQAPIRTGASEAGKFDPR
jgi:hypothetical protein